MRLLDLIAQGRGAHIFADDGRELPGANRYTAAIQACPLRYVLSDELARCATELAFAEGDRLSACLDLIRVPARSLWVEWADAPRREALKAIPSLEVKDDGSQARHSGALISAVPDGRSGHIRLFWSAPDERAYLSPIITSFNLDGIPAPKMSLDSTIWRGETFLRMPGEAAIEEILEHLHCHFEEEWAAYYHARCRTDALRFAVLRSSLGGIAFDAPMLMAFFLLLGAHNVLPQHNVSQFRLNRARQQSGKSRLLEHIEVAAPLDAACRPATLSSVGSGRQSPRLHHVRGHLVRRESIVFWRSPHLRGSARLGQVRTRTVEISYRGAPRRETPDAVVPYATS